MELTLEDKYNFIKEEVQKSLSKNPIEIVKGIMHKPYINIHGPEHHFLDGAAFLVAFKNSGGEISLKESLDTLKERTIKMPGAMCGFWGVCGAVASIGACLAIINQTGPLTDNAFYQDNMEYTASVISRMSQIGGPRCCKRNAFLALSMAAKFVKDKYGVEMDIKEVHCEFRNFNSQCIKTRCPFYKA